MGSWGSLKNMAYKKKSVLGKNRKHLVRKKKLVLAEHNINIALKRKTRLWNRWKCSFKHTIALTITLNDSLCQHLDP